MNLVQLEQLVEIARQKTLSAAAESLHLSQPALSRSMKKLEADLQLTLFTRTKNSMQLNDTGELAVQHAETVLQAVADMRHSLQEFERKKRTIAVGSCAPAPLWKLLPFLANLYPDATISSEIKDTPQIVSGLKTGQYQIAVLPHRLDDEDFLTFKICKEHLFFMVPPAHPLAASTGVTLSELNGETVLLTSNIGFWRTLTSDKMPDSHFIVQEKAIDIKELLRRSALPSFVTDLAMEQERIDLNRRQIPILDQDANPQFYGMLHKCQKKQWTPLLESLPNAF